ncbi:hypothetical protein C7H61_13210 [Mesoflavibacter zeaxanthinifaciens subsp. sabulilitoris]|uniref:Uncharacterized protein n=2 Tax=Mesoflavibacter TaxID=444051 RepID=A0A2T1N654_9FLAO|nr:hypothetical protein C7H61_13210 [Mesoflavibacter zeaxanthinifaciens subsp. sabulilitoris]
MTPDVDLVSELVRQKQIEIKQRVLKNLVVKNIKTTNYTTYNTMYNLINILTTEKNKTVMTQDLVSEISNYSINYVLANFFINEYSKESIMDFYKDGYLNSEAGGSALIPLYKDNLSSIIYKEKDFASYSMYGNADFIGEVNYYSSTNDLIHQNQVRQEFNNSNSLTIVSNYIIDELFIRLCNKDIAIFKSNGLFLKKNLDTRFSSGLNDNYNNIDIKLKDTIDKELDNFINELSSTTKAVNTIYNEMFDLINQSSFDISDLSQIKKDDIQQLFNFFSFSLQGFKEEIGGNSFLSRIGELINKYVIYISYDGDEEMVFKSFKIDVEAIILSFESEFYEKEITSLKKNLIGIKPFFIIGLNYGSFASSNTSIINNEDNGTISDLAYVSEKMGLKFVLFDFDYTHSQKPMQWYKYRGKYRRWLEPTKDPLIDDIYLSIYGSGILYNVVDLKSQDNFDFAMVGVGAGVTFFNKLELNISYSVPIIDKSLSYDNAMINIGFDIPIFEYLRALKNKEE